VPYRPKKANPIPTYLTVEDVLGLHEGIMRLTGYEPQPLRLGGENILGGALARPQQAAYYEAASIPRQAALLCIGVSQAQAFLDGNKRTAVAVIDAFLKSVGLNLKTGSILLAGNLKK
jgi:death-on-curing protein